MIRSLVLLRGSAGGGADRMDTGPGVRIAVMARQTSANRHKQSHHTTTGRQQPPLLSFFLAVPINSLQYELARPEQPRQVASTGLRKRGSASQQADLPLNYQNGTHVVSAAEGGLIGLSP